MANDIYIVKPVQNYNQYGELTPDGLWQVTFWCCCVEHYPTSAKETITTVGGTTGVEGTKQLETAWIEMCKCPCGCSCDLDIQEGYFAYLSNKYWKIVGTKYYENCNCPILRLTLERLTPRESHKSMVECVNCFDTYGYAECGGDLDELRKQTEAD